MEEEKRKPGRPKSDTPTKTELRQCLRENYGLKKGENIKTVFGGKKNKGDSVSKKKGYYISPMDEAETERIDALLSTTEKVLLIGLIDVIMSKAQLWNKESVNCKNIVQQVRRKFANMRKVLEEKIKNNELWTKRDMEYACWCLWFLDELKNEKGECIMYDDDAYLDIQLDLLEKTTEGIVDDYINSERRYNLVMLNKFIVIE